MPTTILLPSSEPHRDQSVAPVSCLTFTLSPTRAIERNSAMASRRSTAASSGPVTLTSDVSASESVEQVSVSWLLNVFVYQTRLPPKEVR